MLILELEVFSKFIKQGDEVNLVIKRARNIAQTPGAKDIQRPRKGDMRRGVVVRCKKMETRPDGRQIRWALPERCSEKN